MNKDDLRAIIRAAIENIAADEKASNELMELLMHTDIKTAPSCITIAMDAMTAYFKEQIRR